MAIQVRRGNEADFDPSNMLPGEWAVSLDTKYVRMCFSSGICLRMATYEAFEADMAEIRNILAEARTIEEAVARIQTEINDTAIVVEDYAILSKSYAVGGTGTRENEDIDNAKYYYEQAKHISQGGNGLVPLGTIAFENLPTEDILTNAMYNISNDFTSDERFLDGGGILYGKGSNVFYTVDGKWDVLAASDVKGIKGEAEDTFRQGNVNITKGNIGLENVDNTSDAGKPISVKQQAEFDRIDSLLGNTDISAIGDGTITGAVRTLNNNLTTITRKDVSAELFGSYIQFGSATCVKIGRIVWLHINVFLSNAISSYGEVLGKLPDEFVPIESFTYGLTPTNPASTASNYFEITDNGNSICYNSPDTQGAYNFCGAYISKS